MKSRKPLKIYVRKYVNSGKTRSPLPTQRRRRRKKRRKRTINPKMTNRRTRKKASSKRPGTAGTSETFKLNSSDRTEHATC